MPETKPTIIVVFPRKKFQPNVARAYPPERVLSLKLLKIAGLGVPHLSRGCVRTRNDYLPASRFDTNGCPVNPEGIFKHSLWWSVKKIGGGALNSFVRAFCRVPGGGSRVVRTRRRPLRPDPPGGPSGSVAGRPPDPGFFVWPCIYAAIFLKYQLVLGDRLMVRRVALDHLIGVRIPVSQP